MQCTQFVLSNLLCKDTEPLYHSFMYSLVSLFSGIYSLPAIHLLLVTLYVIKYIQALTFVGPTSEILVYSPLTVVSLDNLPYSCSRYLLQTLWLSIRSAKNAQSFYFMSMFCPIITSLFPILHLFLPTFLDGSNLTLFGQISPT